ncbi:MAG: Sec-independent protein translocase protein TatB [Pseudomonadota bacterium]
MFDIGAAELLVIVIVAVLVIGPKDMPLAMRTAGRWIGKVRRVSAHFRTGVDAMVREAELEEMEKKWKAQNEAIMKKSAEAAEVDGSIASDESVMTGPLPVDDPIADGVNDAPGDHGIDLPGIPDPMADDPVPGAQPAPPPPKPGE